MATVDGIVGQETITQKTVIDGRHPAVVRNKKFKASNGVIPAGEIVAVDAGGDIVSYDPDSVTSEATPVGVCTYDIDTAKDSVGCIIVHGTVVSASLLTKGTPSLAAHITALESNTLIWVY